MECPALHMKAALCRAAGPKSASRVAQNGTVGPIGVWAPPPIRKSAPLSDLRVTDGTLWGSSRTYCPCRHLCAPPRHVSKNSATLPRTHAACVVWAPTNRPSLDTEPRARTADDTSAAASGRRFAESMQSPGTPYSLMSPRAESFCYWQYRPLEPNAPNAARI